MGRSFVAREETPRNGQSLLCFSIIFIFLILVALYEGLDDSLDDCVRGSALRFLGITLFIWLRELQNDIYFQNRHYHPCGTFGEKRHFDGRICPAKDARRIESHGGNDRRCEDSFRPIIMTSFAFIAGTLPLALSSGAGANSRHIIGTTVVGGMVTLTLIGVFFTPLFSYLIMRLKERFLGK